MFMLTPLLLLLSTTYVTSQITVIEKVHITTIITITGQAQNQTRCDPKCDITYDYLMGVSTIMRQVRHRDVDVHRKSAPTYLGSTERLVEER
jgi:hypothetical protein